MSAARGLARLRASRAAVPDLADLLRRVQAYAVHNRILDAPAVPPASRPA